MALNHAARPPRRRLARAPPRHVSTRRRPAPDPRPPAVARAPEAEARNRGGRGSRRRPVARPAHAAHNSAVVAPRLRPAA